jgi:enoyl-CoA hydratase/carnithine racemase
MEVRSETGGTAVLRVRLVPGEGQGDQVVIDAPGLEQLEQVLERVEQDGACRVLAIEGACQGMDLASLLDAQEDPEGIKQRVQRFAGCLRRLRYARQLVISVVDGPVAGGGVGIATAADICLATSRATFGLPELVLGLLPSLVLPLLHERMPPQKARLLCCSPAIDAEGARDMGLVDLLVEDPRRLEQALRGILKHALRLCPDSVEGLKDLQNRILGRPCGAALEIGAERTAKLFADRERVAVARAFMEGEALPWFDRYQPEPGEEQ